MFISLKAIILGLITLSSIAYSQSPVSCQDQCSSMKFYNCTICYQTCQYPVDPTTPTGTVNFTLQYQSCRWLYCARYDIRTTYNGNETQEQTYCAEYAWLNLNETQCIQTCCNNPSYQQFNNQTFMQCVVANQELHATAIKIALIVGLTVGGVFFVFMLICTFIMCKYKINNCCSNCFNSPTLPQTNRNLPYLQNQVINVSNESVQSKDRIIELLPVSRLVWVQIQSNMKQSVSEYCSICLDGKMNCQTSCGHKFHLLCFQDWIKKSADCPLCKSKNFNEMRIYCERCKNRESRINLTSGTDLYFLKGNNINCDACKDQLLVRNQN